MADTYTNIHLHIVFSTKNRRPLVRESLRERLYQYMGGVVRNHRGLLVEIGGMPDHVHLLVGWNTGAVSDLVRGLKSDSTKWVKATFPDSSDFRWQTGGGIFSVSASQIERVRQYIRKQEEHHRRLTFEEEYLRFIEAHGIEYEREHLFD